MDKVQMGVKCKTLPTEVTCKRPLKKTSKINGSEVQDSPNRGDVQETSDKDFEDRGDVQETPEEDFEDATERTRSP